MEQVSIDGHMTEKTMHKAGFVNIVGNPNVGKSTLMNQLVGERISIATFKAQTTRHRIMGIVNTDDMQIVFSDTPGVLKPNYKLQESMLAFSESALQDADVLLYVTDVVENPEKNRDFLEKVQRMTIPVILLINKIDELASDNSKNSQSRLNSIVEKWHELLPHAEILPISAKNKFGTDMLLKRIHELLPESPAYFDKDQLTDKPARFFVSENTICISGVFTMPMMRWRVVWALNVAIEIRSPTNWFMSVLLPTLGFPTMFTNPALCILKR